MYSVDGKQLSHQYKHHISDYHKWNASCDAANYITHKENIGTHISMDETSLSQGELYTIVTNKSAKGGKGSLIAMIKGTKSEDVIYYLNKIPRSLRLKVKEITIDLSPTMKLIAKRAFPNAVIVSDRFHVQKLMNEAINDLRVDYRWEAIDQENKEMNLAKEEGRKYIPHTFENGDTRRQLLARSRHIVMKHHSKWTTNQKWRAEILFQQYPRIEQAYYISMELTNIYNSTKIGNKVTNIDNIKGIATLKLAQWYNKVEELGSKFFISVINTMKNNYDTIANYFINRSTNASAESFNAKVKAFRSQFRGVRDITYFIFRLAKLFA